MNKILKIILIVIAVLAIGLLSLRLIFKKLEDLKRGSEPQSTSEFSFLLNDIGYECSQKIDGKWVEVNVGSFDSPGYYFQPSNQEDLKKYCRETFIIEYKSVLDILKKDDIRSVIEKYNTTEAWVRALSHKYINDKDYLKRILPAYSNVQIDCIIVVHTPEGTRFFIENGDIHENHEGHKYLEISAKDFLSSLNNAPNSDVSSFWLGLH